MALTPSGVGPTPPRRIPELTRDQAPTVERGHVRYPEPSAVSCVLPLVGPGQPTKAGSGRQKPTSASETPAQRPPIQGSFAGGGEILP